MAPTELELSGTRRLGGGASEWIDWVSPFGVIVWLRVQILSL